MNSCKKIFLKKFRSGYNIIWKVVSLQRIVVSIFTMWFYSVFAANLICRYSSLNLFWSFICVENSKESKTHLNWVELIFRIAEEFLRRHRLPPRWPQIFKTSISQKRITQFLQKFICGYSFWYSQREKSFLLIKDW